MGEDASCADRSSAEAGPHRSHGRKKRHPPCGCKENFRSECRNQQALILTDSGTASSQPSAVDQRLHAEGTTALDDKATWAMFLRGTSKTGKPDLERVKQMDNASGVIVSCKFSGTILTSVDESLTKSWLILQS